VHEVPKGKYSADSADQVVLSSAESDLAPPTKRFIEDNMLDFALRAPRKIREDASVDSSTPDLVREVLSSSDRFVEASQNLAGNLHQAQTGNSPSGIVIVALVQYRNTNSMIVMKAEHQEGMRLRRVGNPETGHFDLEHLNELIVGNNSKVYKIAVLQTSSDGLVAGEMVDKQNGVNFADFFMSTFLGCRLADESEVQTKAYVDSSLRFINDDIEDPERQSRYATAFISYMAAPAPTFQANEFAEQFLEIDDQDAYLDSVPDSVSNAVITKNMASVPGRGVGLRLYGAGVSISVSADALERGSLEIVSESESSTVIRINGNLKRYALGSAPGA
jgi:hypothetical protein